MTTHLITDPARKNLADIHRYIAEFDFRYNHRVANGVDDVSRTEIALFGAKGKRLYYREAV